MKLHYRDDGAGEPLVIHHGFLGSLNNWHTLARALGEHFHVYALDARNHGASPHAPEFGYPEMAADLLEFLDDHRLETPTVLGHSMGGKTAMEAALSRPGSIARLVIVDIAPRAYDGWHDEILEAMVGLDLESFETRDQMEAQLAFQIPNLAVRQFLLTNLKRDASGGFRWKVNLPVLRRSYEAILRAQTATRAYPHPALFMSGERSNHLTPLDHPGILRLFPGAQFRVIPGAGHWVHAEAPGEFLRAVLEFTGKTASAE
jgi:pimeloyl-ACP methyl ester carboxylesterase